MSNHPLVLGPMKCPLLLVGLSFKLRLSYQSLVRQLNALPHWCNPMQIGALKKANITEQTENRKAGQRKQPTAHDQKMRTNIAADAWLTQWPAASTGIRRASLGRHNRITRPGPCHEQKPKKRA